MEDKRQISKRYLIIYIISIIFTILYSGIFLVSLILLLVYCRFWFVAVYLLPIYIGSIRILVALIPYVKRKKDNLMVVCSNSFIENTKTIATKLGSSHPKKIYIIYDTNAWEFKQKEEEVIAIGFPLLIIMNKYELSFVIAHDLAHHFQGDIKYGKNISKVEMVFERLLKILNNRWFFILAGPYRYIAKKIFKEISKFHG
jgi:Zn-dependent protease with chaperone function